MKPYFRAGFWVAVAGVVLLVGYSLLVLHLVLHNHWLEYGFAVGALIALGCSVGIFLRMMMRASRIESPGQEQF